MQTNHLSPSELAETISAATTALAGRQEKDGHWVFELEADATIPAEFVMLEHYMDRISPEKHRKIGAYLRRTQGDHGGWPMYADGDFNMSASVKAYCALKIIGDELDAPHMARAREAILANGGAERSNVFTRIQLALLGAIPWRGVPTMPVQIMFLPKWFFFNIWAMSYWARVCVVPLLVIQALRPKGHIAVHVTFSEIFRKPPHDVRDWIHGPFRSGWGHVFKWLDVGLKVIEPVFAPVLRERSIKRAVAFVEERLNDRDGLGAIYPAMAYSLMMYDALSPTHGHPNMAVIWRAIDLLIVEKDDEVYCQPCVSPVWDTCLSGHAMFEAVQAGGGATHANVESACDWLLKRQITDVRGDWAEVRPDAKPGGWAFQYRNDHYPDVDDTAVAGMLLLKSGNAKYADAIERARHWIIGMQSTNGGWGAFDADNDKDYLNNIPFADHGALLDPPTADVTARCISFLCQLGHIEDRSTIEQGLAYLRREQEKDGSWFGRWGTNYIYGTWSVLCALNIAGIAHDDPMVQRAADWLISIQRADGGWGEDERSYDNGRYTENQSSLPTQTAWAMLGLMAVGRSDHPAVETAGRFLTESQKNGEWEERSYNAVGFPRVFYLKYHGYRLFFPLMALSRMHNLRQSNSKLVATGF